MNTCATCIHSCQGPNLAILCTLFGCTCTEKTAEDCTDYQREPGSDDESQGMTICASYGGEFAKHDEKGD